MHQHQFKYGPIAQGVFTALLWMTLLVSWVRSDLLWWYVMFLAFLGVGLRPVLEWTGLYKLYSAAQVWLDDKFGQKLSEKEALKLWIKERDKKFKMSTLKDSKLPKNW